MDIFHVNKSMLIQSQYLISNNRHNNVFAASVGLLYCYEIQYYEVTFMWYFKHNNKIVLK